MSSIARAVERSVAIVTPARTPASTAVAATSPTAVTRAPLSRRRSRRQASAVTIQRRSHDARPPPASVFRSLRPVAADGHRAPRRRGVPRGVVEEPAAALLAARLHPAPRTRRLRVEHTERESRRARGYQPRRRARAAAHPTRPSRRVSRSPEATRSNSLTQPRPRRLGRGCSAERATRRTSRSARAVTNGVGVDDLIVAEKRARSEPVAELLPESRCRPARSPGSRC